MYADLMDTIGFVAKTDKTVADAMAAELGRQRRNIELIASENFVSPAVMAAMVTLTYDLRGGEPLYGMLSDRVAVTIDGRRSELPPAPRQRQSKPNAAQRWALSTRAT